MTRSLPSRSIFLALLWPVWERNKTRYKIAACILLSLASAMYLPIQDIFKLSIASFYATLSVFLTFTVVGIVPFGISGQKSGQPGSTYSREIFALPVSTREFIFIPIIFGILGFIVVWMAFVMTTIVPLQLAFPIELPIIQAIAAVCLAHCLWWIATWKRRLVYLTAISALLIGFVQFELTFNLMFESLSPFRHVNAAMTDGLFPRPTEELALIIVAIASIFTAMAIAPLARHQSRLFGKERPQATYLRRSRTPSKPGLSKDLPKLESAFSTQSWFEGARHAVLMVPCATVLGSAALVAFSAFFDSIGPSTLTFTDSGPRYLLSPWMPLPIILLAALYFSALLGGTSLPAGALKGRNQIKGLGISPFEAIRPISSSNIVRARLLMAAKSSGITAIILAIGFLLYPIDAAGSQGASTLTYLAAHPSAQNLLLTLLLIASLGIALWSIQAGNVLLDLKGIKGYFAGIVCGTPILMFVMFQILEGTRYKLLFHNGVHNTGRLESPEVYARLIQELTVGALIYLGAKFILAMNLVNRIRYRNLLSNRSMLLFAAIWVATATLLIAGLYSLLPPNFVSASNLALIVMVILPVNRIFGQIICVDTNRHR